jgi:5,5'-dehydrodivanillate O-demethylase
MLSAEGNERLTKVGPGTPMGELMRRYWHPVATAFELSQNPVKAVRILGESLTLYQDRSGTLGLIAQRCAHRSVDLRHGIPQEHGIRCPYHGWMYDETGQCTDQPAEDPEHGFKDRVQLLSYPVEEMGGLIWAYLGPTPAPILPKWGLFMWEDRYRSIGTTVVDANWLQCQENSVDTVHTEWAHGWFGLYACERKDIDDPRQLERYKRFTHRHTKIAFDAFEKGIIKRRLQDGQSEDADSWVKGHPLVFPNYVYIGQQGKDEFQIRVPMDDTHTWHLAYHVYNPGIPVPTQDPVPSFEVLVQNLPDFVLGQDMMMWVAQGEVTDRSVERLAETDRGLILFRRMLEDQIKINENGGDPMNVFREEPEGGSLTLPIEDYGDISAYKPGGVRYQNYGDFSPFLDELDQLMQRGAEAAKQAK